MKSDIDVDNLKNNTENFLKEHFTDAVTLSIRVMEIIKEKHGMDIPPVSALLGFATKYNFLSEPLAGYDFPEAKNLNFDDININELLKITRESVESGDIKGMPYFALVAKPALSRLIALQISLYQKFGWCMTLADTLRFKDTIKKDNPDSSGVSFDEFIKNNSNDTKGISNSTKARFLPLFSSLTELITNKYVMVPSKQGELWSFHCRGDAADVAFFDHKTGRPIWLLSPVGFMHQLSGWGFPQPGQFTPSTCYSKEDYCKFFQELAQKDALAGISEFYEKCTGKKFSLDNLEEIVHEGFENRNKFKEAFEHLGYFPWFSEYWHLTLKNDFYAKEDLEWIESLRKEPLVGENKPAYFGLNATVEYAKDIYLQVMELLPKDFLPIKENKICKYDFQKLAQSGITHFGIQKDSELENPKLKDDVENTIMLGTKKTN